MAGEVELDDTLGVDGFDELAWLEIVVEAGNENVVDIEQQQTIGELSYERPFVHL
jgi:hypothetical protein